MALLTLAAGVARGQSFGAPLNLSASFGSHGVASGDFNGDGNPDIVSANNGDGMAGGTVSIFLGGGDGTFGPKTDLPAVRNAQSVAVGDFDKDGKSDLIVANSLSVGGPDAGSIFLGNGDGTFKPRLDFTLGSLANMIVTSDFDEDGNLDAAVVGNGVLNLLLGNGDGTFKPRVSFFVADSAWSLVAADFNRDGHADIAAAGTGVTGLIDVMLGKGDGTFHEAARFVCGPGAQGLSAGDLDGDGTLDLATANTHNNTVSVLLGNGDGSFRAGTDFTTGQVPQSLALADLDGDGKLDAVLAGQGPALYVHLGNGDGTLRARKSFDTGGGNPIYVTTGDLNRDNRPDLIGASFGGSVQVLFNRSGALSVAGRLLDDGGAPLAAATLTLSGPDTATTSTQTNADGTYSFGNIPAGANVTVTPSKHNYVFTPPSRVFGSLSSDATADFAGELLRFNITGIVSDPEGARLRGVSVTLSGDASATATTAADGSYSFTSLPGSGSYTVTPTLERFAFSPGSRTFDDLSANRAANFVGGLQTFTISGVVRDTSNFGSGSLVRVTLSGSRTATTTATLGMAYSFPGLTIGGDYTVTVSPVTQFGLFRDYKLSAPVSRRFTNLTSDVTADFAGASLTTTLTISDPNVALPLDFNGDGKLDLLVSAPNFAPFSLLPGNGDGTFGAPSAITRQWLPSDVALADLNGDGKLDIAYSDRSENDSSSVRVMLGNGDGTFQPSAAYRMPFNSAPSSIAVADFNGDGRPDLAAGTSNRNSSEVVPSVGVFINKGDGTFNPISEVPSQAFPLVARAGDFNGDGKPDLATITFSAFGGAVNLLPGKGDGTFGAAVTYPVASVPVWLTLADFDRDGNLDVATSNSATSNTSSNASVFLGNGDGTLRAAVSYPVNSGVGRITPADFDGDGALDLVVSSVTTNVLLGNGDGTFKTAIAFGLGSSPSSAAGDFDGDGRPDLVALTTGPGFAGQARVLLNATQAPTVQFGAANYRVAEGDGLATITVTRTGDLSRPASVAYATSNFSASERADYTAALGTLRFAVGESSKSFDVFVTDDALFEGGEALLLGLSNPNGAGLGALSTATLTIISDDGPQPTANPVNDSQFYVRQHYRDFLGRDPDASGLAFWTNEIESCGSDAVCREVKRIHVSAAFFLSIEFQETGFLVYRLNQAAFNAGETVRLRPFIEDTQEVARGLVVGAEGWPQQLESNKQTFVKAFVSRAAFNAAYPETLTPAQFVDALNANTRDPLDPNSGGSLTPSRRDELVNGLAAAGNTTQARAETLRAIVETPEFQRRHSNKAFVLMQYFGYLRRNPDDLPDRDFAGHRFWLSKLDEFKGNFVQAEMVKAFISSDEYRKRFGQ